MGFPPWGVPAGGLRILSEMWNPAHSQVSLVLSGLAGKRYDLAVWNPSQIASVRGGKLKDKSQDQADLTVEFPPANAGTYVRQELVINFVERK